MPRLFSDGLTPEEAGRKDAREAMAPARAILRAAACDHDPVLDNKSGCYVCAKCGRGVNVIPATVAGKSELLGTRILRPYPKRPDCDCMADSAFKCFRVRRKIPEGETVTKYGGPCTCKCHIKDED